MLALDLGTRMGWALKIGNDVTSGVLTLCRGKEKRTGARYYNFRIFLKSFSEIGLKSIAFEKVYAHKGIHAAHVYGGFHGILQDFAYENKIACFGVGVGVIKRFATGNGRAKKEEMIRAIRRTFIHVFDHNEADALALLLVVESSGEGFYDN